MQNVLPLGQSEELLQILNESSDEEQVLPDDIVCAVQMYENSDGMAKLVILSLQNHEKYSRQFLINAFDCNLYRISLQGNGEILLTNSFFQRSKFFQEINSISTKVSTS